VPPRSRAWSSTVGRSHADFLEPFGQSGRFAGLSVEHAEVFLGEDHIWADFERDHDKTAFGARWAAFPRASVFPTLARGLDGGGKDPRAAVFIDKLESGIAGRMASAPGPMVIPLAKLVFTREKD